MKANIRNSRIANITYKHIVGKVLVLSRFYLLLVWKQIQSALELKPIKSQAGNLMQ